MYYMKCHFSAIIMPLEFDGNWSGKSGNFVEANKWVPWIVYAYPECKCEEDWVSTSRNMEVGDWEQNVGAGKS